MSLLVVGSMAFDSIKTPHGSAENILGGSAVYFSIAASRLVPVRLVGVVGEDYPREFLDVLGSHRVDTAGVEFALGKTFRWSGEYFQDMNRRQTLSVELNVFEKFQPKIPPQYRDSEFVFLANGAPVTQLSVLSQIRQPRFVMADTMDLWINTQRRDLEALLRKIDGLLINDDEALLLTGERNLVRAGKAVLAMGPRIVVLKKGEHGGLLITSDLVVPLPAYPLAEVSDPTGAGDSFAGGLMGYLASQRSVDAPQFKAALAMGTVIASFTVEDFGVDRLLGASPDEIRERFNEYCALLRIDGT